MSYLALYRKFRPQTFDEIVGQDFVVTTLKNQIKSGNISHAYLFTGKDDCRKGLFARNQLS